jgi:two-component system, OmpR family, sensor kinase
MTGPGSRLTLRRRLVLGIAGLLAAITLMIGVVSVLSLQGFLMNRLDAQLDAATNRSQGAFRPQGGRPAGVLDGAGRPKAQKFLARSGQPEGILGAVITSGAIVNAAVLDADGRPVALSSERLGALLSIAADTGPTTVDLGDELGRYRVVIQSSPLDSDLLVIGLPLRGVEETVVRLSALIAGIGLLGVTSAVVVGVLIVRAALRPLERVVATATKVAEIPLDHGDVALAVRVPAADADPSTEVGAVGSALNRMLEHVASALESRQSSENRVRTFVADASHELRTPLASIRGYSELTRRGNHELPDDVVHAMGRIESESVRMTSLVEDLLLLARLDEGNTLESTSVSLDRLLVDAISDAKVAGPGHHWSVDVPDVPVLIHGDAGRLHQVVANLLSNARSHTPEGTSVTATLRTAGTEVIVEVADTGPGIDEGLLQNIFERFVRGDGSRSRARGSTGLGLAIVSAVVDAHGGRVEVRSEPGDTVFRVILPRGSG